MTEKITRFTTEDERDNIAGIELDPTDVDHFMDQLRKGLVEAAADHVTAVQGNFALRAETTIRLSRPVRDEEGNVVDHVGRGMLEGTMKARKVFIDPSKAPEVD